VGRGHEEEEDGVKPLKLIKGEGADGVFKLETEGLLIWLGF
jgi:hypothetical protein